MKRFAFVPIVAVALFTAGCGSGESGGSGASQVPDSTNVAATTEEGIAAADRAETAGTAEAAAARRGTLVKVISSQFGRVIADGRGEAFYLFDKERSSKSRCYGACAVAWPPVLTKGKPRAGAGAKARLLGTTKRANGKLQVTYAGKPLYYYVDDSPGVILCHDVFEYGGDWLVVKPNGRAAA